MTTTVVLPCFNPQDGWEKNVVLFYRSFTAHIKAPVDLVIVFDGPGKNVQPEQIKFLNDNISSLKTIPLKDNNGKGYALRKGIETSDTDLVIYTDVDFPYTMESVLNIYHALESNDCDVAIGVKDHHYYEHLPRIRKIISKSLQFLIRLFIRIRISDTQCGLKGFKRNVTPIFLRTTINRYLFDLEFVRNCCMDKNLKVKAIPVTLNENVHFRKMNYRILFPEMMNFVKLLFSKQNK